MNMNVMPLPHAICACPCCGSAIDFTNIQNGSVRCSNVACRYADEQAFPVIDGRPALVDFGNSVIDRDRLIGSDAASYMRRPGSLRLRLFRMLFGLDESAAFAANELPARLRKPGAQKPRLLVIGGGAIGSGMESIYGSGDFEIVAFDIYASPNVQLIADAHSLPFVSDSFDAVWVQAVLEHVLEPEKVVAEIHRVLRPQGLVYAGTPFMQQVHEGAYDFTRFTELGHRWLFRRFECIGSGAAGGPGVVLQWAIRYFVAGLFRNNKVGRFAELSMFWLRYFDKLMPQSRIMDGASGVWFLGIRSDHTIDPKQIIKQYRGAQ
jgi:SAM-dependent methyltransferase